MHKPTILLVAGARPNFMKVAPVWRALDALNQFRLILVHTGQHYDDNMSKVFFEDLKLPKPDAHLGVGSGSHAEQTAKVMVEMEKLLTAQRADLVVQSHRLTHHEGLYHGPLVRCCPRKQDDLG